MFRQSRKGWLSSAVLFSLNARWPLPPQLRREHLRGWEATTYHEPLPPPDDLTDKEIERAQRLLGKQSWTLIRKADGRFVPMRML